MRSKRRFLYSDQSQEWAEIFEKIQETENRDCKEIGKPRMPKKIISRQKTTNFEIFIYVIYFI